MISAFLSDLAAQGIKIKLQAEDLSIEAPKGVLVPSIIGEIKARKQDIIPYLRQKAEVPASIFRNAEKKEYYPLSPAQKRMYFINCIDPHNLSYNMVTTMEVDERFDAAQLELVLSQVITRHESLRTAFRLVNNEPVQVISSKVEFRIEKVKGTGKPLAETVASLVQPFNLEMAPLMRAFHIEQDGRFHLLVDIHHIVTDGISQDILTREIGLLHSGTRLTNPKFQYKDFAAYQNSRAYEMRQVRMKEHWLQELAAPLPQLNIPTDHPRPAIKQYKGKSVRFYTGPGDTVRLRTLSDREDATMFMTMLAVFKIFLHKLSGQDDIIVGIPLSGRQPHETSTMIGMFINTLPARSVVSTDDTFAEFLRKKRDQCITSIFEHQDFQFDNLVAILDPVRDPSRNPIFDVILEFFDKRESKVTAPAGHDFNSVVHTRGYGQFDLSLNVTDCGDFLCFDLDYSTALFKPETIDLLIGYWKQLIGYILAKPQQRIQDISLLSDTQRHQVVSEFNNTKADYPSKKTLLDLFDEQVERTPNRAAVTYLQRTWSFAELQVISRKIATWLQRRDSLAVGDLVGVMLPREAYLIPSIFGVLQADCAYVPIDPELPADRINTIAEDAKLKIIITRSAFASKIDARGTIIVDLDRALPEIEEIAAPLSARKAKGNDLAYVLYTSGSTGKPKGVMIEHHAVINRILWMQKEYPIGEKDVILQKTPIVFDVSVWELFWWSITGARLVLLKPGDEKIPLDMMQTIDDYGVTVMHFIPSMLSAFLTVCDGDADLEKLKSLRLVFASGEALKPGHAADFGRALHRTLGTRLINLYGPTEATVDVSHYECTFDESETVIPIGKPIDNTAFFIVGKTNEVLPIGVAGELCIAGAGVARGYLGNEKLTTEKFVTSPFEPYPRMYRTGDLARWTSSGNVEFLGRIDHQVKIRGFRIELGEIENILASHPAIEDCAVLVREKSDDKYLVGYYVAKTIVEDRNIKTFLGSKLPDYMIPIAFVHLEKMPLTVSGKTNRKALPELDFRQDETFCAPENEVEEKLVAIWSEVLGVDPATISVTRNFFDLGGHSLRAVIMTNKITKAFDVTVPLHEVLKTNTIRMLADYIQNERWIKNSTENSVAHGEEFILE
jgi:amino acid adenylation domain-containing protein